MKKNHRKDVIIARVIFAALLVAVLAVLIAVIALFVNKGGSKEPSQKPSQSESQSAPGPAEPFPEPTEPDTTTEPEGNDPSNLNTPAWTTTKVNLRSEPNTDCEIVRVLEAKTTLIILSKEDGWAKVYCGEDNGYIKLDYLTEEDPMQPAEPQEPDVPAVTGGKVIVLDPGHQLRGDSQKEPNGPDSDVMKARVTSGTSGRTTGVMEYELNLDIALQLRAELQKRGYTVYMTRETHDVNISNMERAQYATSVGADICVRIHANGVDDSSISGALALAPSSDNPYVAELSAESQALSRCILNAYCAATGLRNQGVSNSDTMTGINWSTVPVTILEMGYMSNPSDDKNMQDDSFQRKMVQGIANGIDEYYNR